MGLPTLNSPAEITQAALIEMGLGTLPPTDSLASNDDWPIYATNEPNEPDNCITVLDGVNQYDGRGMPDGNVWIHYGIVVQIRSQTHQIGYQKAWQIFFGMSQQIGGIAGNLPVMCDENPYLISTFTKLKGPLCLGIDAPSSKRFKFTINAQLVL